MADNNPIDAASASSNAVDREQLERLVIQAAALRDSGDQNYIENTLAALDANQRKAFRPLLLAHFNAGSSAPYDTVLTDKGPLESSPPQPGNQTNVEQPQFRPSQSSGSGKLPAKIGKFRIAKELGRGAFGVVYLGFDDELQRKVAIKVSLVTSNKWQSRLRIEAAKLAKTESTGIVPVYDIGSTDEGAVYVVQKYIDGCTLRDLIKKRPLSPARAVRLMRAIAIGLEPAHRQEILHRDLKPDNILIDELGKPWIADFGLAISEQEQFHKGREVAGTPLYMSPEQIKGRVDFLDPRSDIWALGVMLYEVLTNKLPFNGTNTKALAEQICELDPRPLHQRAPGVLSEELNAVFERCCAKQPADRFATVRELANALDELVAAGLGNRNILGEVVPLSMADSAIQDAFVSAGESTIPSTHADSSVAESRSPLLGSQGLSATASTGSLVWVYRLIAFIAIISLSILGSVVVIRKLSPSTEITDTDITDQPSAAQQSPDGPPASADLRQPPAADSMVAKPPDSQTPDSPPPDSQPPEPQPVEPQPVVPKIDADGSPEKPWIVASDGTGTHLSIAAAIKAANEDDIIQLKAGTYQESLQINRAITIEGLDLGASNQAKLVCTIMSDSASPVIVDCPRGTVTLRQISIDGRGHPTSQEFNAVDVVQGTLNLEGCAVNSSSFNCVKVKAGASLAGQDTQFHDAREFAISTKDHAQLTLTNCLFRNSGVQVVGGTAVIDGCKFYGKTGVYVADSVKQVALNGCLFQDNFDYGLAISTAGLAVGRDNSFQDCRYGIWATRPDPKQPPGKVTLFSTTCQGCDVAINVQGGTVHASQKCQLQGGNIGIGIETGEIHLADCTIANVANGIKVTGNAELEMQDCVIERCSATALDMLAGSLDLKGGRIGQSSNGIVLGNKDSWPEASATATITDLQIEFDGPQGVGIMAYSGPLTISDLTLTAGGFGIYAEGPKAQELSETPLTLVSIRNSKCEGQADACLVALGDSRISLNNCQANPAEQGRARLQQAPAEIIEKKPTD